VKRREFITLLGGVARLCFWEDQVESGLVAGINRPAGILKDTRTADADRAWWLSRIRARANPFPHGRDLCHEAPTHPVARTSRSSATGSIDNSPGGFLLH